MTSYRQPPGNLSGRFSERDLSQHNERVGCGGGGPPAADATDRACFLKMIRPKKFDRWTWLYVAAAALAACGCAKPVPPAPVARPAAAEAQDAGGTAGTVRESAEQATHAYLHNLDERVAKRDEEIAGLNIHVGVFPRGGNDDWPRIWNDLRQRRREMRQRVEQMRSASAGTWNNFRQRTDDAWNQLYSPAARARQRLKINSRPPQPRPDTVRQSP